MAMEPPYEIQILHVDPHERIFLRHLYIPDGMDRSKTDEPSKVNQLLSLLLGRVSHKWRQLWVDKIYPLVNFHKIQTKDSHNLLYCEIVRN